MLSRRGPTTLMQNALSIHLMKIVGSRQLGHRVRTAIVSGRLFQNLCNEFVDTSSDINNGGDENRCKKRIIQTNLTFV